MYYQNSNRGMFLETLMHQTALYYQSQKVCLLFKRFLPISIFKRDGNNVVGHLQSKSESDYYGVYKGRMLDFELKQTNQDDFILGNLKEHQWDHLSNIKGFGAIAFLLIHFVQQDKFYVVTVDQLLQFKHKTKIPYVWCVENCFELEIVFPGVLNLEAYLKISVPT